LFWKVSCLCAHNTSYISFVQYACLHICDGGMDPLILFPALSMACMWFSNLRFPSPNQPPLSCMESSFTVDTCMHFLVFIVLSRTFLLMWNTFILYIQETPLFFTYP
jgi:hypothetical protein